MRASANSWSSGPERRPTLTCAGQNKVEMIKLLGLYIDNQLTYKYHTGVVVGRVLGKVEVFKRL